MVSVVCSKLDCRSSKEGQSLINMPLSLARISGS
jgi:hypothetical protein